MKTIFFLCAFSFVFSAVIAQIDEQNYINPLNPLKNEDDGRSRGAVFYYIYNPDQVYTITTTPGVITTILLQPGEKLINPPAAGEESIFTIAEATIQHSGSNRTALFVKPMDQNESTNMILSTNRRTYFLMLNSTSKQYMFSVAWDYPSMLSTDSESSIGAVVDDAKNVEHINFNYKLIIARGSPKWKPTRILDDGINTYIYFPDERLAAIRPALFSVRNGQIQLINYIVKDTYYIVEGLHQEMELRIGSKNNTREVVKIVQQRR